jgi:hypothetical protein
MRFLFLLAVWVHGDFFKEQADHVLASFEMFEPAHVQENEIVFVQPNLLPLFFHSYHPKISHPYILITHNSPLSIPGKHQVYLDDPKIISWYGVNVSQEGYPKLHLLPLGGPNGYAPFLSKDQRAISSFRGVLLYLNFTDWSIPERIEARRYFESQSYCLISQFKSYPEYFADLTRSKFVVSPRGLGLDCYRTWEALVAGAIPIVLSSPLDSLYSDLPVLIIQDWSEINEIFLLEKYEEMKLREYNYKKLRGEYWLKKIKALE